MVLLCTLRMLQSTNRLLLYFIRLIVTKGCALIFFLFPTVEKFFVDRQIVAWRKEQNELKMKLVVEDTEEWQSRIRSERGMEEMEEEEAEGMEDDPSRLRYVGGVDVSFSADGVSACASLVVCDLRRNLGIVHEDFLPFRLTTPYRPGYLAFREVPALMNLWRKLLVTKPDVKPQVVLIDGNGVLHPHRFGSASHFGVLIDTPTVGVAKKLYHVDGLEKSAAHKQRIDDLLKQRHDAFDLVGDSGAILGVALRTGSDAKNPVYISVGHRISLSTAVEVAKRCSFEYRVPEPIRQADVKSREWLRET